MRCSKHRTPVGLGWLLRSATQVVPEVPVTASSAVVPLGSTVSFSIPAFAGLSANTDYTYALKLEGSGIAAMSGPCRDLGTSDDNGVLPAVASLAGATQQYTSTGIKRVIVSLYTRSSCCCLNNPSSSSTTAVSGSSSTTSAGSNGAPLVARGVGIVAVSFSYPLLKGASGQPSAPARIPRSPWQHP